MRQSHLGFKKSKEIKGFKMQSIPERILPQTVASLLAHDDDWHEQRRKGIGGSDAMKIMSGDWLTLWEEKTGRAAAQDLSDVLPVVMGAWTEPLNRYWFEKKNRYEKCHAQQN